MCTCARVAIAIVAGSMAAHGAAGEPKPELPPIAPLAVTAGAAQPTPNPPKKNPAATYREVYAALGKELLAAVQNNQPADSMLTAHAPDIERLVEATRASGCDFGVDYSGGLATELPHLAMTRALARVLRADPARLLAAGDAAGASKRVAAIERLAAHVLDPAQSVIELMVACALGQLGAEFVNENAGLAKGAGKPDLQQAIKNLQQRVSKNTGTIVRRDGDMVIKSLREGKMLDMSSAADGRDWTKVSKPEREAAAKKLVAIYAEIGKVWDAPDAVSRLEALGKRAKDEGVGDLFPALDKSRKAVDELKKALGKASTALNK